jgi:signal transduction histidine kinase/CheY-like chemotaxis protein
MAPAGNIRILAVEIAQEHDVVLARRRAREIAEFLGFPPQDQTRIATAVSEITRNAVTYGGGGRAEFFVVGKGSQSLLIEVSDQGPGVRDLEDILREQYRSPSGLGIGIVGARRLMDDFSVESADGEGTRVRLFKTLPVDSSVFRAADVARLAERLARARPANPLEEFQHQNQELLAALAELRERQEELVRMNQELLDTNRGVVALYAEMEEQAANLRRADELKTRFLSNMSHEFRTPLNSILALSRILLERIDGDLNDEQERQIKYVQRAAQDLTELVNDLLDLARVEAGKIRVDAREFHPAQLFSTLRGMLRPLLVGDRVNLVFEDVDDLPTLHTDEGKVSQILRNFISNAIKFTEYGEVRVSGRMHKSGQAVVFAVADTGIGIPEADQQRIFQEFTQLDTPLQVKHKGSGLGLPLSRRLAELLGGTVWVRSEPGRGATFSTAIPIRYDGPTEIYTLPPLPAREDPNRFPVLVVEDNAVTVFEYQKLLKGSGFQPIPAPTLQEARAVLRRLRPVAIMLDVVLPEGETWEFLQEIKHTPQFADIPVLVASMVEEEERGLALGAAAYAVKPVKREWLLDQLRSHLVPLQQPLVLVVDDDDVARYIVRDLLADSKYRVLEAGDAQSGLALARQHTPDVILIDLVMDDVDGFELVELLKADPELSPIPVLAVTSKLLSHDEVSVLSPHVRGILSKTALERERLVAEIAEAIATSQRAVGRQTAPGTQ